LPDGLTGAQAFLCRRDHAGVEGVKETSGLSPGVLAAGGAAGAQPDRCSGVLLGVAGLLGWYVGARLQGMLTAPLLRRLLGVLAVVLAVGYVVTVLL
jgi:hypothetical protein